MSVFFKSKGTTRRGGGVDEGGKTDGGSILDDDAVRNVVNGFEATKGGKSCNCRGFERCRP